MNLLITGTSRGIGLELTKIALEKGYHVWAVARNPKRSKELSLLQEKYAKNLSLLAADFDEADAPKKIAELFPEKSLDVLINNAGIYRQRDQLEDFLASFQVNSVMPYLVTKALLPKLKASKNPKVVQITSLMGSIADNQSGGSHAYRASKTALNMINKSLSQDESWLNTAVVHPGWVKTDMGGENAPVEVSDSAAGIWRVMESLNAERRGGFFDYQGKNLPW